MNLVRVRQRYVLRDKLTEKADMVYPVNCYGIRIILDRVVGIDCLVELRRLLSAGKVFSGVSLDFGEYLPNHIRFAKLKARANNAEAMSRYNIRPSQPAIAVTCANNLRSYLPAGA